MLVSAATALLVEYEKLTDLGEHRFKDLGAPERVYQLGDGEFPALKSLHRTNLPIPATAFLGRERELREVVELLERDDARLVTLTGPGGTGKTRLTLQAAVEASDGFSDGVRWIPLASVRDEDDVGADVCPGVGGPRSIGSRDRKRRSSPTFSTKRSLLVVDNCEHLVAGVADSSAGSMGGCPNVVVAASSRERLGLQAERMYEVPPMAISDGHALFVERASAVQPWLSARRARGRDLRRSRPASARDRARRRTGPGALDACNPRASEREARAAGVSQPRRRGAAADARGHDRLVLRPPRRRRATRAPSALGLRGRLHVGCG